MNINKLFEMENKNKAYKKNSFTKAKQEKDVTNSHDIVIQNIIIANKKSVTLSNEEIAAQGFTVSGGHNPNKSNPYAKLPEEDSDLEGFNDFRTTEEELENPSMPFQNFNETEAVLEAIDDNEKEKIENNYDEMEGDEHERNHLDNNSKK